MQQILFNLSDQELIRLFLSEDNSSALETLFFRYKDKLYQSILFWGIHKMDAEDLAQESMFKAIKSLQKGKYSESDKFFPWLLRIARNLMIDNKRREKRGKEIIQCNYLPSYKEEFYSEKSSPEFIHLLKSDASLVKTCIQKLPASQRDIIMLRIYHDKSFKEISEILDISLNTALGRMRYGIKNLKKLWDYAIDDKL